MTDPPPPPPPPPAGLPPGYWLASDGQWYPPTAAPGAGGFSPQHAPPSNGTATAAMVLGIVSVLFSMAFGLSVIFGGLAIGFGVGGLRAADRHPSRPGRGQAIAGIITGALGVVLGLAFLVMLVLLAESP